MSAALSAPGATVIGVDADADILQRARSKARASGADIDFVQAFSTDLPYPDAHFDVGVSTLFFHHLSDTDKHRTVTEVLRVLRPGGRLVVADLGRPQDPLMRLSVLASVQLLDGFEVTSANVAGELPRIIGDGGFAGVRVSDRLRTPIGTLEIVTGERPGEGSD